MTKAELVTIVEGKTGYVAILKDAVAPDNVAGTKEKRYMLVETLNTDGTKGITNVTYVLDTGTDEAWFYNAEPVSFDTGVVSVPQATIDALKAYCVANFEAYFLIPERIDAENNWAVVEAYTVSGSDLAKSTVMVYKKGTNPITHVTIV